MNIAKLEALVLSATELLVIERQLNEDATFLRDNATMSNYLEDVRQSKIDALDIALDEFRSE